MVYPFLKKQTTFFVCLKKIGMILIFVSAPVVVPQVDLLKPNVGPLQKGRILFKVFFSSDCVKKNLA